MTEKEQTTWLDFGGEWLKAAEVVDDKEHFVVTAQEMQAEKDKNILVLTLEREGRIKKFGCNKTNLTTVQKECPTPKDVIGKIVAFNKVQANNPKTQELVDALRIKFVK